MSAIEQMLQAHKLSCVLRKGGYACTCGRDEAAAYLAAMQARIEKLEVLQTIAEDVNTWLIKNKLGGTAHQRMLAEALYSLKGEE